MKNKKKEISVYKYKLGKVKIWSLINFKKQTFLMYNSLKNYLYIKFFLEIFFFLLTRISKNFFRYFYIDKKRKFLYLFKFFLLNKYFLKSKKFLFFKQILKKSKLQNIKILKKKFKFRFKFYRIKSKFFFNNILNILSFFLKNSILYVYCNIALIFKKKYFSFLKIRKKKKFLFLKRKKLILLQLFLLKIFLEKYFFLKKQLYIKFYFYNFNNYKAFLLLKFPILYLLFLKKLKKNNKKFKIKSFFLKKNDFFFNKLNILTSIAFNLSDIKLLILQFCERITKIHKHKYAIKQINEFCQKLNIFNINNFGIKILIQGKINAKTRTKKVLIKYCKESAVFSLVNILDYCYFTAFTYTGVFGVHIWLVKQSI